MAGSIITSESESISTIINNNNNSGEDSLMTGIVRSIQDTYGRQVSVVEHTGRSSDDYEYSVKLKLSDVAVVSFHLPRNDQELMDVFLSTAASSSAGRGSGEGKPSTISNSLKSKFNQEIVDLKGSRWQLAEAIQRSLDWWTSVGELEMQQEIMDAKQKWKDSKKKQSHGKKTQDNANKANGSSNESTGKSRSGPGLRPAQDIVGRILWDEDLPVDKFTVGYLDRFIGVIEKPFEALRWEKFSTVDPEESAIPRHRIQWFKFNGYKVWDRESRLDLICGSGISSKVWPFSIRELIVESQQNEGVQTDDFEEPKEEEEDLEEEDNQIPSSISEELSSMSGVDDVPAGLKPDYYLSIPIQDEITVGKLACVQSSLKSCFPDVIKKNVPRDQFHVTLCLFLLKEQPNEDVRGMVEALDSVKYELSKLLSNGLDFKGLRLLRQYKVVVSEPDFDQLNPILAVIKRAFDGRGIRFYAPSRAHLTLCRLKNPKDPQNWTDLCNMCQVSRFKANEPEPDLSLKTLGNQSTAVEQLTESFFNLPIPTTSTAESEPWICSKPIGFHVRDAKLEELDQAVHQVASVGGKAFAFFLQDKRGMDVHEQARMPTKSEISRFQETCRKCDIELKNIMPHGPYKLNPASGYESYVDRTVAVIVSEMEICHAYGIQLYNIHMGQLKPEDGYQANVESALDRTADTINRIHAMIPENTVKLVLETGSGSGKEIGRSFEEIGRVLNKVVDQSRIGVCIDTCHIFAAGYDIRSDRGFANTMEQFNEHIGFHRLAAFHLNDSRGAFNSGIDRHEQIGSGLIELDFFHRLMSDPRFDGIPMILETPWTHDHHLVELQTLEELSRSPIDHQNICGGGDDLDQQIRDWVAANKQTGDEFNFKKEFSVKLEEILKDTKPFSTNQTTIQVCMIGGAISGIGSRNSDLDLSLIINERSPTDDQSSPSYNNTTWDFGIKALKTVQQILTEHFGGNGDNSGGISFKSTEIRSGVIPILRFEIEMEACKTTRLQVDLNCNDLASVHDSRLLRAYCRIEPDFAALSLVLKEWAKRRNLSNAQLGFPNSYSYVLMVLHYCQHRELVPNLQAEFPAIFSGNTTTTGIIEDKNDDFDSLDSLSTRPIEERRTKEDLHSLLSGFFVYFSDRFDFSQSWISIKSGGVALSGSTLTDSQPSLMYIEDPYERKNTSRCVLERANLDKLISEFRQAADCLKTCDSIEDQFLSN